LMISAYRIYFIDVRTPSEFADGHIDSAINIDLNSPDFISNIEKLDRDNVYIIYCRTGVRSAIASQIMVESGFLRINNMTGGYLDWVDAGLPVEK